VSAYSCELALVAGRGVEAEVLVEVEGDRIAAVTPGAEPSGSEATRLEGIVIPGFANAHSHAFQRALRGRTQAGEGSFWTWRQRMYRLAESLTPDSYRLLAQATFGEMLLAGVTTVGEFHYLHHDCDGGPYDDRNAMGAALISAGRETGIRLTLLDTCYLHGGIGAEPEGAQRRFSDGDVAAWAARVDELSDGPKARVGAAIHSVRAVDPDSAKVVAAWAAGRGTPLHAHVSEQVAENEACLDAYGATPAAVLAGAGAVGDGFTAVHATHLSDADIRLLGEAGATCCLCPTTERDLGDGIAPAGLLSGAGSPLALGTDSNALIDMFEEARAVELDERLVNGARGIHPPGELLGAATASGHACLGWPDAGRIEPGALCDLVAVDVGGVRLAGTDRGDPVPSLVFAGSSADVRDVVVGGEWIVRDRRHTRLDVAATLSDAISALE
jgi:formiminoglutamate deiminase